MNGVERLAGIALNTFDADRLAAFYVDALGFTRVDRDVDAAIDVDVDVDVAVGVGVGVGVDADADRAVGVALRLGDVRVDLIEVDRHARPYPAHVAGWSPLFQHFAIVVTDMKRAIASLSTSNAWSPISRTGPERLPADTGGVTAFKFRDPEGHPLEFLMFPDASAEPVDGPCVRIDHSAISVADVARSIAFYEGLGLRVKTRSLNTGLEQQRMDDIDDATVDVIGLAPSLHETPHVELLGYCGAYDRHVGPMSFSDIAASRLLLEIADDAALGRIVDRYGQRVVTRTAAAVTLRDPDEHLLTFSTNNS